MSEGDAEGLERGKDEIIEAWQQPAFSRETIKVDPWTAVYLPPPENASRDILEYARTWATDLVRYAENEGAFSRPLDGPEAERPEAQRIAHASLRADVLDAMIGREEI